MKKGMIIAGAAVLTAVLTGCYNADNTYGSELVGTSFRNVYTDTSTVVVSSIVIDSLETSGLSHVLAGCYRHELWGLVSAEGYVPYNYPNYKTDVDAVVTLDSLVLQLKHTGYFTGDTTAVQRYYIHRLTEKIVLNDNGYLYNRHRVAYEKEPIGRFEYVPRPHSGEVSEVRLSDELGRDLLEKFHTRDMSVSEEHFEDYFKGIAIIPDETVSRVMLAFSAGDTLAALSLRYRVDDAQENQEELLFTPYGTTLFSHIEQDPTGTLLEPYFEEREIASELLGNRGFIMGGMGRYVKLEFPHLNDLLYTGEKVEIEDARLLIYPETGSYSDENLLPDSIYLYIADENNVVTDAVKDYLGEQVQSGILLKDDVYAGNTFYYFDVTDFMQQELGAIGMYKHNLQLVFSSEDYTGTVRNMTFGDRQGTTPIVLQLRYKIYESY